MEEDERRLALREREPETVDVGMPPPQPMPPAATDQVLDPRVRRGSVGPPAAAAPLPSDASGPALHAHLHQLLTTSRASVVTAVEIDHARAATTNRERALAVISLPAMPHEDLERQPDGIPHVVVGLTALSSVALAAVVIRAFSTGSVLGVVFAITLALVMTPVLVVKLGAKAERERDHEHPSR